MKKKLTQKRLKELLRYDPETGIFIRVVSVNNFKAKKGDVAGGKNSDGYIQISIDENRYLGHRLAWFYVYGYFPENQIDHRDRDKSNNKIENLREVSPSCNSRNTETRKDNTSGIKGVSWSNNRNKWQAQIVVDKKVYSLGRYNDFSNAVCIRLAAEQCLNWSGCDSSSPAFQYVQENIILSGVK